MELTGTKARGQTTITQKAISTQSSPENLAS
jgi:hypothetical protein